MARAALNTALESLSEAELRRLAVVAARLLAAPSSLRSGDRPRRSVPGRGIEFLDHRPYAEGDDARHIDWRASARRTSPLVRRYRMEASADWHICVDRSASMGVGGGDKWALASQLAAAMAYVLLFAGHRVCLFGFSRGVDAVVPLARGQAQFTRILGALASATPAERGGASRPGACARYLGAGGSVFLVSDFLARGGMQRDLRALEARASSLHAVRVTSENDIVLPPVRRLMLECVESGDTLSVDVSAALQDEARRELQRLGAALADYCARGRIVFTDSRADEAWREVVLRHLKSSANLRA